jgi:hypothetical protein
MQVSDYRKRLVASTAQHEVPMPHDTWVVPPTTIGEAAAISRRITEWMSIDHENGVNPTRWRENRRLVLDGIEAGV